MTELDVKQKVIRTAAVSALAVILVIGFAPKAEATFVAWICDTEFCNGGGTNISVADESLDDNAMGVPGIIDFNAFGIGGLSFVGNTSFSKPEVGSAGSPIIDISFSASGIGEAWLYAADTDFTGSTPLSATIDGNFTGDGEVEGVVCGGQNNDQGTIVGCVGSGIISSSPFSFQWQGLAPTAFPHAWTIGVRILRESSGVTSGDLLAVPEPASLTMLGLGLVGLGAGLRRRQKRNS